LICEVPPKRSPPEEPLLRVLFSSACSFRHRGKHVACQTASHLFRANYNRQTLNAGSGVVVACPRFGALQPERCASAHGQN
jgi:hypothetical protein